VIFFISVGRWETDVAVLYVYRTASKFGRVVFHVDDGATVERVRRLVGGDVDIVAVDGLGAGRSWAVENIDDDVILSDSHVYFLERPSCGSTHCDFRRFDFGFDVEDNPVSVVNRSAWHFGQVNWNRAYRSFIFDCDVKWYSHNPVVYISGDAVRRIRDVYMKYGLRPIPWRGYGADMEQLYVSASRLFGPGKCVYGRDRGPVYGHRASVSNTSHQFWSERWRDAAYYGEWYRANVCFLKLHYPRELWSIPRSRGFDPEKCDIISDDVVKKINDEFRYSYADFLRDFRPADNEDVSVYDLEKSLLKI